jgi:hypothetical protein
VLVAVSAPRGALLGPSLVTGQVLDDDPPPTVRIAPARAAEGGTLRFAVTVSPRSGLATQVRLRLVDGTARRGTDFAGALRPQDAEVVVEVPPGATSAVAAVDALRDDREEGPETFRVRVVEVLQARLVGPRTVTGTISGP